MIKYLSNVFVERTCKASFRIIGVLSKSKTFRKTPVLTNESTSNEGAIYFVKSTVKLKHVYVYSFKTLTNLHKKNFMNEWR